LPQKREMDRSQHIKEEYVTSIFASNQDEVNVAGSHMTFNSKTSMI
jgi:hypothetical protein